MINENTFMEVIDQWTNFPYSWSRCIPMSCQKQNYYVFVIYRSGSSGAPPTWAKGIDENEMRFFKCPMGLLNFKGC
jgi:hypothetical protein